MELRLPLREWIRLHLAKASIPEEKIDKHAHGVWSLLRKEAPANLSEQYDPITEKQFLEKYGRHLEKYLGMSNKGKIAFEEKPPGQAPNKTRRWFGIDGDAFKN